MTLSDCGNLASIGSFIITGFGLWQIGPALRGWKLKSDAWKYYVAKRIQAGEDIYGFALPVKPGTREFELAEYLVDQGKMVRRTQGFYGFWKSEKE